MPDPHCHLASVDVLTTGTAAPHGLDYEIVRPDVDLCFLRGWALADADKPVVAPVMLAKLVLADPLNRPDPAAAKRFDRPSGESDDRRRKRAFVGSGRAGDDIRCDPLSLCLITNCRDDLSDDPLALRRPTARCYLQMHDI